MAIARNHRFKYTSIIVLPRVSYPLADIYERFWEIPKICNFVGREISPLIANAALHGLETAVAEAHPKAKVIRYADDLVVLHPDLEMIKEAKRTVSQWLDSMGLELKPSKTRITHTLNRHEGKVGFDFLGFHIQQHRVGKTHSGKTSGRYPKLLGFKTIIKPSKEAIQRHYQVICFVIDLHLAT